MKRVVLLLALTACLDVPSTAGGECAVTSDCNVAAGEVCREGLCYGNPPPGMFAATLSPPREREDLTATELAMLELPADGWLGELTLESPVTISGRVEAYCATAGLCTSDSLAAVIRVTRPSRFPGGPTLRLTAQSKGGLPRGTDSFTIQVPRTEDGDPPYTITIDPDGGGDMPPTDGSTPPAELVPPRRIVMSVPASVEHQTYTLGGPTAPTISGTLKDPLGGFLTGYRVVALGRWDAAAARTEVSSVDFTTNGQYAITLSEGIVGPVEIVAKPYQAGAVAPTLHVPNVPASTQTRNLAQPPGLGERVALTLPIRGLTGEGGVEPVAGARVIVTGVHPAPFPGAASAVLTSEAITDDNGDAVLQLLDGEVLAASYRLRVVPPLNSRLGVIYDQPFALGTSVPVQLPSRVAIRGRVVDVAGEPLADVSVTARRSLGFLWSLAAPDQAFLDEIPAATALTPRSGDFVVWVDPSIADAWGTYDLAFEPPASAQAPRWTLPGIEIPRIVSQTTLDLATIQIPAASFMQARVVDRDGLTVQGSALRVFQLPTDSLVCTQTYAPEQGCTVDAQVVGHGDSDAAGVVRFTLPRP